MKIRSFDEAGAARLIVDNPPVNALSLSKGVVASLTDALRTALDDPAITHVTIEGAGGRFSAGADILDFELPPEQIEPTRELFALVAGAGKPVIALITGEAFGGGLELALACHARLCTADARLGLPEINLGLLPGSGGTQRTPRLIGVAAALDLMLTGKPVTGAEALSLGLVDEIQAVERLRSAADAMARKGVPTRAPRADAVQREELRLTLHKHARLLGRSVAARQIGVCVEAALDVPLYEGLQLESRLFHELMASSQSRALRYAFFSERAVARLPGLEQVTARPVASVGIVGGGTMGSGIAAAALEAGFRVTLTDTNADMRVRAETVISGIFDRDAAKGRITPQQAQERQSRLTMAEGYEAFGEVDLVIEAVFEDMAVKQAVLRSLEDVVRPDCILASNTSTLDLDILAAATADPARVIGLHFFSPAHIMRLLEIVRGRVSAPDVVATALAFAKRLRKVPVVSGVCDGFIGNRMFEEMLRQAYQLLEEGALPAQVDGALERFGMAMGPLKVMDLAGQDIGHKIRQRRMAEHPDRPYSIVPDILCELGRLGQKTKAGFYDYPNGRNAVASDAVNDMIRSVSAQRGIDRRAICDEEIVERCIFALINEGAKIVEEGIAARPLDVDMVWLNGYGFPRDRGGPMFYADELGLTYILARIRSFEKLSEGWAWKPASLLVTLADAGRALRSLDTAARISV
ncbi:3-hydroxyacyl-CoA dehydrogenase NAD-binding domain-containing protein [Sphingobium subterraneum]|uniref:3-hydroxyacyl-CoA dehydrogenase n=1 Tax=Sphingobium subterraneum TaxID=627688 RepID=A0A841J565_9SPHN|nr:3-hydroxyacyl-CoA dehydrogenase NAD-binding domain-containing protein [Sphingobium subterraneum]MBB6123705.1 3-hydroxyacyl-CoA dehydrogenase [Sphingobium subterraneum]